MKKLRQKAVPSLLEPGAHLAQPLFVSGLVDALKRPNPRVGSQAAASLVDLGQAAILELECRLQTK